MRLSTLFLIVLALMCFFAVPLVAQQGTGSLQGLVADSLTSEPLPGAAVQLEGTSIGASADISGRYVISRIPAGTYTVVVRYVGYRLKKFRVEITADAKREVNVALTAEAVEGETVIVTAQARGQQGAINRQLSSNTITSIVSAEKIRELPDENAATALSRLPGLSLQDGDKIVVRGIQAKQNLVMLNGVQLPSTDMNDRSTNLGFISSNMLSGIEVTKVVTPDMDANAIGGVVNLRLREAPEGLHFDILAQGMYNGQDRTTPIVSNYQMWASVSDRFFENSLGVYVQGNARRTDGGSDNVNAGFGQIDAGGYGVLPYGQMTYGMNTFSRNDQINVTKDNGGSIILDYVYGAGKVMFQASIANTNNNLNTMRDVSQVFNSLRTYTIQRDVHRKELFMSSLQGENTLFEDMKVDYSIAQSYSSKRTDLRYGDPFDNPGFDFSSSTRAFPGYGLADQLRFTLEDTYNWPFYADDWTHAAVEQFGATRNESFDERLTTGQLNVQVPLRLNELIGVDLKFGGKVKFSTRTNDVERTNQRIVQNGSNAGALEFLRTLDSRYYANPDLPLQLSDFKNFDYPRGDYFLGGLTKMDNVIYAANLDKYFALASPYWHYHTADSRRYDFKGQELIQAGYAMGTFTVGPDISVIAGARFEHFRSDYHGTFVYVTHSVDGNATTRDTLNTALRTSDQWFPNFQIRYKATDWFDIRVAYSTSLSRPDYTATLPSILIDGSSNNATVGNPNLLPAKSKNVDVFLSFYNNDIGLFTIGGFYKRIDDFFYSSPRVLAELRGTNIPYPSDATMAALHLSQLTPTAQVTSYMNNPNPAFLRGVEMEWQTSFWYLPSPLNYMVLNVNYTRLWSGMDYQQIRITTRTVLTPRPHQETSESDTIYHTRLLNQGDNVVNVSLGFDYMGLSARLSYRLQGDVLTGVGSRPEQDTYTGNVVNWDLAINQKLPVEGMSVFFNGMNIFHNSVETYQDFRRSLSTPVVSNLTSKSYYPSWYELGIRYSF